MPSWVPLWWIKHDKVPSGEPLLYAGGRMQELEGVTRLQHPLKPGSNICRISKKTQIITILSETVVLKAYKVPPTSTTHKTERFYNRVLGISCNCSSTCCCWLLMWLFAVCCSAKCSKAVNDLLLTIRYMLYWPYKFIQITWMPLNILMLL